MRFGLAILFFCLLPAAGVAQTAAVSRISNLRSAPSTQDKILQTVPANSQVTVISKYPRDGYVRVQTPDKQHVGWILQNNLQAINAPAAASPLSLNFKTSRRSGDPEMYPDSKMTPGAPDPSVTQDNIDENICNKGWTTSEVRPATSVTGKIKTQTMEAYGFTDAPNHYELDHLISLQDGGCPDCVENLWPEAYGDTSHPMTQSERAAWNRENPDSSEVLPGSLEKDEVENHIHDEICFDIPNAKMTQLVKKYPPTIQITLERGQQILAADWFACYQNMKDGDKPCR